MNKIKKVLSIWLILIIFSLVTLFGFISIFFGDENDLIPEIYAALDTASAVALAILAFYAYFEYTKDKKNTKKFLEQLEKIDSLENKDALVGIQFGGGNKNATEEMKKFGKEKNIDEDFILTKAFGDENNQISKTDIVKLENYLKKEVIPMLSGVDRIHLTVAGVGIAFYVCADIFSNWKPTIVYHRGTNGKYEKWTTDNKHREKVESTLKDI